MGNISDSGDQMITGSLAVQHDAGGNNAILLRPDDPLEIIDGGYQMSSQLISTTSGGTPGHVYANVLVLSTLQGAMDSDVHGSLNIIDYGGTGGSGLHVANYNQALRRSVNARNANRPRPRPTSAGDNPGLWGGVFDCIDYTNTPTSTVGTSMNGIEVDMTCGNVDDAKMRRGIGVYVNKANPSDVAPTVDTGLHMAGITGHFISMVRLEANFDAAAIDLRTAIRTSPAAHTIWLGDAGDIAWNTAGTVSAAYDASMFGTGGVRFNTSLEVDGTLYTPGNAVVGGVLSGAQNVSAVRLQVGDASGPTWTTGATAPTSTMPIGSLYSRTSGAVGSTLYVSRGGGNWTAVA